VPAFRFNLFFFFLFLEGKKRISTAIGSDFVVSRFVATLINSAIYGGEIKTTIHPASAMIFY
jgi:uncharacterized membrane protein YcaP (DUF421 family)